MTFTGNGIYNNKGLKVSDGGKSVFACATMSVKLQLKHINGKPATPA